jgi:predicted TIM-barrel fold metal-dependent hydrolase
MAQWPRDAEICAWPTWTWTRGCCRRRTQGVQNFAPEVAVSVARKTNDALAEIIDGNAKRLQALRCDPTPAAKAAAAELEHAITKLGFRGPGTHSAPPVTPISREC